MKHEKPRIKQPEIFEVNAGDVISGAVNIDEKIAEIKKVNGELRIVNKKEFFKNGKKHASLLREIILKCDKADIYMSSDGIIVNQDGPFDKDRANELDRDNESAKKEITKTVKTRGNRLN